MTDAGNASAILLSILCLRRNSDVAIAALLLGPDATQRLYGSSQTFIETQLTGLSSTSSPFLQRLRLLLKHCCAILGPEETNHKLALPKTIAQYLIADSSDCTKSTGADEDDELADCLSLEHSVIENREVSPVEEKKEAEEALLITEEQKRLAVSLYTKGIKLQYIAGLFGIINPKVINSWGDWKKRPKYEADKNVEKRKQMGEMLERGETVKAIRTALKLKERVYREFMGIAIGSTFPRTTYESVMQQMAILNSRKVVSKNTGVPVYFIKRWQEGKGIPDKSLFESDAEGSAEVKRKAVIKFYDSGNAVLAARSAGVMTPQIVERWVVRYQHAVDERERNDPPSTNKSE